MIPPAPRTRRPRSEAPSRGATPAEDLVDSLGRPLCYAVMTASVRPGVFFDTPPGLPRGPHQLSREEVEFAQRQRLLMAFTELLADRGYANLRIADLTKRAGVSNDSFYALFASKEDCVCAAYKRFVKVIVRMANDAGLSESQTWREYIHASVAGYLGALSADPVVARAFQLEIDVIGGKAREDRRNVAAWFAEERLKAQERLRKTDPHLKRRPVSSHLAAVLGMREVACDLLGSSQEPDFNKMVPELVDWVVAAWYGEEPRAASPRRSGAARRGKARRVDGAAAI
jgi:AcrR family transcriptional regulator